MPLKKSWIAPAVLVFAMTFLLVRGPVNFNGTNNIGSWIRVYNYPITWFFEWVEIDLEHCLEKAEANKKLHSDKLNKYPLPVVKSNHIVIIQAESLSFDVVNFSVNNQSVMPFLSKLTQGGRMLPIKPVHLTGSADADFVLLSGHMPNGLRPPYLPGFHFDEPLSKIAHNAGYQIDFFHGNHGAFFERRFALHPMQFDNLFFESELQKSGLPKSAHWGVDDHVLFPFSSKRLTAAKTPTVHFIVTLTTHAPWKTPKYYDSFKDDPQSNRDRYLNAMSYLDHTIEEYYETLPEGTVLFIYGDHGSAVPITTETASAEDDVPFIVVVKGDHSFRPFPKENISGLSMLDAASYIRNSIRQIKKTH